MQGERRCREKERCRKKVCERQKQYQVHRGCRQVVAADVGSVQNAARLTHKVAHHAQQGNHTGTEKKEIKGTGEVTHNGGTGGVEAEDG